MSASSSSSTTQLKSLKPQVIENQTWGSYLKKYIGIRADVLSTENYSQNFNIWNESTDLLSLRDRLAINHLLKDPNRRFSILYSDAFNNKDKPREGYIEIQFNPSTFRKEMGSVDIFLPGQEGYESPADTVQQDIVKLNIKQSTANGQNDITTINKFYGHPATAALDQDKSEFNYRLPWNHGFPGKHEVELAASVGNAYKKGTSQSYTEMNRDREKPGYLYGTSGGKYSRKRRIQKKNITRRRLLRDSRS